MFDNHAVVLLKCNEEMAREAINVLDQSFWMDNNIKVKFNQEKPVKQEKEDKISNRSKFNQEEPERKTPTPSKVENIRSRSNSATVTKEEIKEEKEAEKDTFIDQIVYEIWIWSLSLREDKFMDDMVDQISSYGTVQDNQWKNEHDVSEFISIRVLCTVPQIIECVSNLNKDPYFDGRAIRAKFPDDSDHEASLESVIENYPSKLHPVDTSFQNKTSTSPKPTTSSDKKIKCREIWLWTPAINAKKTFIQDMTPIVSQYGKIKDQGWQGDQHIFFILEGSEKQAAKCISKTHGLRYKATDVRAKFADGSPDENLYKDPAYAILLRNYDEVLIPESYKAKKEPPTRKVKSPTPPPISSMPVKKEVKIVLPGMRPVPAARPRSLSHEAFEEPITAPVNFESFNPKPRMVLDAVVIDSVHGKVYSVSSKLILIEFRVGNSGNSQRFARIKPGQMYVDAQKNLGYLTINLRYPDWPDDIKDLFKLGNELIMDVRRLTRAEEQEMIELTSETVTYETSLVWKPTIPSKPSATDLIRNQNLPLFKATVIKLWPKWAILQPLIYNGGESLVLMVREEYHSPDTGQDNSAQSLLSHIEIGDTLAVLAKPREYLDMVDKAKSLEFFKERTNHLKYETVLAWPVVSEIDPYNVLLKKKQNSLKEEGKSPAPISFLASSNSLNLPLPGEKEATYKNWKGYVEQLNLPGGGIIRLTEGTSQSWAPEKQRVYFHRARMYLNSVRMTSQDILEEEVSIGDLVTVDVIANQVDMTTTYLSGTDTFWMALAVKLNTADRGLTLANRLRAEVSVKTLLNRNCQIFINYNSNSFFAHGKLYFGLISVYFLLFAGSRPHDI